MGIFECLWLYIGFCGSMGIYRSLWVSMDVYGYL